METGKNRVWLYEFDAVGQYMISKFFQSAEGHASIPEEKVASYPLIQRSARFEKLNSTQPRSSSRRSRKGPIVSSTHATPTTPKLIISLPKGNQFHAKRSYIVSIPWNFLLPYLPAQINREISPQKLFFEHLSMTRKGNSIFFCEAQEALKNPSPQVRAFFSFPLSESQMHPSSIVLLFHEEPLNPVIRGFVLEKFIAAEKSTIQQIDCPLRHCPVDKGKHESLLEWELLKNVDAVSLDSDCTSVDSTSHVPLNTEKYFHAVCPSDVDSYPTPDKEEATRGLYIPRLNISDIPRFRAASTSRRSNTTELLSRYEPLISCVIPDALYVGGEKPCADPEYLRSAGITTIINLSPESSVYTPPADMDYHEFDMRDNPKFDIKKYLEQILQIIEGADRDGQVSDILLAENGCRNPTFTRISKNSMEKRRNVVYLHCQKGISRSVTMAIAYTVWKFDISVDKCLSMIKGDTVGYGSGCSPCLDGAHTNRNLIDAKSEEITTLAGGNYKIASTRPIAQPNAGFTVQLYNLEKCIQPREELR